MNEPRIKSKLWWRTIAWWSFVPWSRKFVLVYNELVKSIFIPRILAARNTSRVFKPIWKRVRCDWTICSQSNYSLCIPSVALLVSTNQSAPKDSLIMADYLRLEDSDTYQFDIMSTRDVSYLLSEADFVTRTALFFWRSDNMIHVKRILKWICR